MAFLDLSACLDEHRIDPSSLPNLTQDERTLAVETWRGRMLNEHASSRIFAGLLPQLMAADIDADRQVEIAEMIMDEQRHARQCAAVVEALGAKPAGELHDLTPIPSHSEVGPLEALLRNVLSICCLSETVAVALINAERLQLGETVLGDVLKTILADEVSHARFGWSLLENIEIDAALKTRLSIYLSTALAHLEEHELAHLSPAPAPSEAAAAAGVCDGSLARQIFHDTVNQVILPRLKQHGLEPLAA
jgi:hypothetical protein